MPTGPAVVLHPAVARRSARPGLGRRAGRLAGELSLFAALLVGGTVAVAVLLLVLVVAAPLAALLFAWVVWRSGDAASRRARAVRARLRRRARALRLVVLAGSQPALVRLAASSAREPSRRAP